MCPLNCCMRDYKELVSYLLICCMSSIVQVTYHFTLKILSFYKLNNEDLCMSYNLLKIKHVINNKRFEYDSDWRFDLKLLQLLKLGDKSNLN